MLPAGLAVLPDDACDVLLEEGFVLPPPEAFALEEPPPRSTLVLFELLPEPPPESLPESSCPLKSSSVLPTPEVFASVSCLLSDELLPPKLENV